MSKQSVHIPHIPNLYKIKALQDNKNLRNVKKARKIKPRIRQVLDKLDREQNQQDEGIQDYRIGGYHPVHIGQIIANRYVVIQKLGWGHFSTVWLCKDFKHNTHVAIKIQKSSPNYTQAALDEVEVLQKVSKMYQSPQWANKTRDDAHVVGLLNAFIYKSPYGNHFCMVFEILKCNLLDVMKNYNFEGLPLHICQQIAKQILEGLDYLHRVCGIIHTDLKPENLMIGFTKEQLQEVVSTSQLKSKQLYSDRIKLFRQCLGYQIEDYKNLQNIDKSSQSTLIQLKQQLNLRKLDKNQKKRLKQRIQQQELKINTISSKTNNETQKYRYQDRKSKLAYLLNTKSSGIALYQGGKLKMPFHVKLADLGNASWKHHHFSTIIQTRQYRSPEVILGHYYSETADIWSFVCIMYQLLTGNLLFQPKKNKQGSINADHLNKIQKLVGPFNNNFIVRNPSSKRKYFKDQMKFKCQTTSNYCPIQRLLMVKNRIKQKQAKHFAQFIRPMLVAEPQKRIRAKETLQLPWLKIRKFQYNCKMNDEKYDQIRERIDIQKQMTEIPQKVKNLQKACLPFAYKLQIQQKKKQRIADIRYVDRSFTDLGYIGYCDGINFDELDICMNWQFS